MEISSRFTAAGWVATVLLARRQPPSSRNFVEAVAAIQRHRRRILLDDFERHRLVGSRVRLREEVLQKVAGRSGSARVGHDGHSAETQNSSGPIIVAKADQPIGGPNETAIEEVSSLEQKKMRQRRGIHLGPTADISGKRFVRDSRLFYERHLGRGNNLEFHRGRENWP